MNQSAIWYAALIKPSFAPPSWLFGPVWTVLYVIIAITFIRVFYLAIKRKISATVTIPFILNLIFNLAFTPIQFGLQNNYLGALDVLAVLFTLVWAMSVIWPHSRKVALWQIPYLVWVLFATVLQLSITYLNI